MNELLQTESTSFSTLGEPAPELGSPDEGPQRIGGNIERYFALHFQVRVCWAEDFVVHPHIYLRSMLRPPLRLSILLTDYLLAFDTDNLRLIMSS